MDCSIGTPCDPPPDAVVAALGASNTERGYPASIGSLAYREAAAGWMARRHGVDVVADAVAACVGTKFVASAPQYLRLRQPDRDTALHPSIAYPTHAMGAVLAGCRAVAYDAIDAIDPADARRAVCLWVNSPANPHGDLIDLGAAAAWGRARDVPVLSDECYVEFTWASEGRGQKILEHGADGVLAVHSLSKRSNLAGARAGCYAGDADLVRFLGEVRKHAGQMVPGPVQAAAVVAWADDEHVEAQRGLPATTGALAAMCFPRAEPAADARRRLYLWAPAPAAMPGRSCTCSPSHAGIVVTPGETFGPGGAGHVRVAAVQPDDRIELAASRVGL